MVRERKEVERTWTEEMVVTGSDLVDRVKRLNVPMIPDGGVNAVKMLPRVTPSSGAVSESTTTSGTAGSPLLTPTSGAERLLKVCAGPFTISN